MIVNKIRIRLDTRTRNRLCRIGVDGRVQLWVWFHVQGVVQVRVLTVQGTSWVRMREGING